MLICTNCKLVKEDFPTREACPSTVCHNQNMAYPAEYEHYCPGCGAGSELIAEAIQCDVCGEWFEDIKKHDGLCYCEACLAAETKPKVHPLFASIINMHFGI